MKEKLIVTMEVFLDDEGDAQLSVKFDKASVKSNKLMLLTRYLVSNIESDIEYKFRKAQELTELQLKSLSCCCDDDNIFED